MDHMTRRLDPLGTLFQKSWALYKRHFSVAIQILIIPVLLLGMARLSSNRILIFVSALIFALATLSLIAAIGKGKGIGESYKEGAMAFFPIIWVGILNMLALIGGFVMLIIPGIMMIAWFVFSNYIVILEGKRGLKVLEQSKEYVRGYWWAIFGRYFLIGVLTWLAAIIVSLIAYVLLGVYGAIVIYAAFLIFAIPFTIAYSYEVYENIRAIKGDVSSAAAGNRGFLLASVLVGIAAPIVIIVGFILGAVVGMRREQGGNVMVPTAQSQDVPPPSAGTPFPQY